MAMSLRWGLKGCRKERTTFGGRRKGGAGRGGGGVGL